MTFYMIVGLLAWAMVMILTFGLTLRQERLRMERERDRINAQLAGWRTAHQRRGL